MPAAETTGGRPSAKVLQILFWAGVGLAPLAALLLLFGGGFVLQLAAVLAVGVVVLIGLSIALRGDNDNVRGEVEETMFEELDTLRDEIRGDITHAARATHGQLVERIGVLHETVDALRNQVDMMRGQLERTTRAAQQAAAAQHAGPQPTGSASVPQGVLRHTETVQVTTKTMVVDPTDQRRDGTVYGARPEIPQQRRPVGERVSDRDADWHETGRVVDGSGHWSEPRRQGWDDDAEPAERGGRAGAHDRGRSDGRGDARGDVRGDWSDRDGDAGRADRTGRADVRGDHRGEGRDWSDRGEATGRTVRGEWADGDAGRPGRGEWADSDGGRPGRGEWSDGDAGRSGRGEWADGDGGRSGRGEWSDGDGGRADRGARDRDADTGRADRGRGDWDGGGEAGRGRRGEWSDRDASDRDRGDRGRGDRDDKADRGERSRGDHADRGGRGEHTDRGEQPDRTDRGWGAERISRSERTERSERSEWTERSERSEWIERTEASRDEPSWTEQLLRERMARAEESQEVERSGGRRRAYDPDDDAGSVTGVRTTDRWASMHSDERGGRELRMGERRAAVHADETGTHVRIEDRWASVRHEEYVPAVAPAASDDEPRRESPRRSEARRERERQRETGEHWSESSYEEARRDDTGTTRWSEVRRQPALGSAQAALPAAPASRWQEPAAPSRDEERVSRRARNDDDEDYGWNGSREDPRTRPAPRQIVDFEGNDDRWR
ncbi:hypothetical protein [Dactylosporangium sp. NPDC005555]|uniref:hypothetical protein n=1 Tax=Dactylosporangium sp. NPDC005555 TaxID=3154889 RepID=UPI0033BBE61D